MQPKFQGSFNILKIGRNLSFFPASYSKKTKWMLEMDLQVNTLAVLHVCTYIHTYVLQHHLMAFQYHNSGEVEDLPQQWPWCPQARLGGSGLQARHWWGRSQKVSSCVLKDSLVFTQGWSSWGRNCQVHRDQGDIQYCFSLTSKIQCSGRLVVLGFGGKEEI